MAVRVFHITQQVGFFPEMNILVISLTSVWVAVELQVRGRVQSKQGDYATMETRHLNDEIRFPLFGPVAAAIANRLPDDIEISVVDGIPRPQPAPGGISGLRAFLDSIFQPFIVNYYERHLFEMRTRFGPAHSWPGAWQMARVVRNAISHSGRVHFVNMQHPPVTWRGLTVGPGNQGQQLLGGLLNGADLFVLAADMEEERSPGTLKIT